MNESIKELKQMLSDIGRRTRTRDELLPYYIEKRLNLSLQSYYHDMVNSYKTILNKGKNRAEALRKLVEEEQCTH